MPITAFKIVTDTWIFSPLLYQLSYLATSWPLDRRQFQHLHPERALQTAGY